LSNIELSIKDDFDKPIIAWQRITQKNQFCLTKPGTYVLDSMAFLSRINNSEPFLLAVLNSDLMLFWMKMNVHEYGSAGFRLSNQYVELMPIIKQAPESVKRLLQSTINGIVDEETINHIVYDLYEITPQEQAFIETVVNH